MPFTQAELDSLLETIKTDINDLNSTVITAARSAGASEANAINAASINIRNLEKRIKNAIDENTLSTLFEDTKKLITDLYKSHEKFHPLVSSSKGVNIYKELYDRYNKPLDVIISETEMKSVPHSQSTSTTSSKSSNSSDSSLGTITTHEAPVHAAMQSLIAEFKANTVANAEDALDPKKQLSAAIVQKLQDEKIIDPEAHAIMLSCTIEKLLITINKFIETANNKDRKTLATDLRYQLMLYKATLDNKEYSEDQKAKIKDPATAIKNLKEPLDKPSTLNTKVFAANGVISAINNSEEKFQKGGYDTKKRAFFASMFNKTKVSAVHIFAQWELNAKPFSALAEGLRTVVSKESSQNEQKSRSNSPTPVPEGQRPSSPSNSRSSSR